MKKFVILFIAFMNDMNTYLRTIQVATILWDIEIYNGFATFYTNSYAPAFNFLLIHLIILYIFFPTIFIGFTMYLYTFLLMKFPVYIDLSLINYTVTLIAYLTS